jgi:hypothetical protein
MKIFLIFMTALLFSIKKEKDEGMQIIGKEKTK